MPIEPVIARIDTVETRVNRLEDAQRRMEEQMLDRLAHAEDRLERRLAAVDTKLWGVVAGIVVGLALMVVKLVMELG